MQELVANDDVVILHEGEMYSAVMRWVKHDLSKRRENIAEVLKVVRESEIVNDRIASPVSS